MIANNSINIHTIVFFVGFCVGLIISFMIPYLESKKCGRIATDSFDENSTEISTADQLRRQMTVLCWVMTAPENHYFKAVHIKKTWGRRCDILLFMSSMEDSALPAIALPVLEGRQHLWEKTREAFKYLYEYYLEDVDWFLKADDDTYVIMENLRLLLSKFSSNKPYYLGSLLRQDKNLSFMYGGSGYILSKEALRRYIDVSLGNPSLCFNPDRSNNEDMYIGKCLENADVEMVYTHDHFGRERFLHNNLPTLFDEWGGIECCSDYTVTMHYIAPKQMYVMDYFMYSFHLQGVTYVPEVLEDRGKMPHKPERILSRLG